MTLFRCRCFHWQQGLLVPLLSRRVPLLLKGATTTYLPNFYSTLKLYLLTGISSRFTDNY
jgi:hypothetical protein